MFSLFVVIVGLIYGSKESSQSLLGLPRLWGPSEVLVKTFVELNCELLTYPQNETILLQLYKQDNRDKMLAEYSSLDGEVAVFPLIARLRHEGNLVCVAKAQNSNVEPTVSDAHYLKVIEKVQGAAIMVSSGSVEMFEGATLELNCTITSGNHVSYKWLLNNKDVFQSHLHDDRLLISRTTSADSGSYMCVATNDFNSTEYSTSMSPAVNVTVKGLIYGSKESSQSLLGLPRLWGPSEVLVKKFVELNCELLTYPQNETILLQLYKQDNRDKMLAEYTSLDGEVAVFPLIARLRHEGNLVCVAKAQNSNVEPTVSDAHYLKVIG